MQAGRAVDADVKVWEAEEAARKAREHDKVMQYKALQEAQVAEKDARVRQARTPPPLCLCTLCTCTCNCAFANEARVIAASGCELCCCCACICKRV